MQPDTTNAGPREEYDNGRHFLFSHYQRFLPINLERTIRYLADTNELNVVAQYIVEHPEVKAQSLV